MQMETFAPLMFAGLVLIMLIGFPVAFSLSALGIGSGFFAIYMGWFPASFMSNLPLNMFGSILFTASSRATGRSMSICSASSFFCFR